MLTSAAETRQSSHSWRCCLTFRLQYAMQLSMKNTEEITQHSALTGANILDLLDSGSLEKWELTDEQRFEVGRRIIVTR